MLMQVIVTGTLLHSPLRRLFLFIRRDERAKMVTIAIMNAGNRLHLWGSFSTIFGALTVGTLELPSDAFSPLVSPPPIRKPVQHLSPGYTWHPLCKHVVALRIWLLRPSELVLESFLLVGGEPAGLGLVSSDRCCGEG
jgi:hypothetical protein